MPSLEALRTRWAELTVGLAYAAEHAIAIDIPMVASISKCFEESDFLYRSKEGEIRFSTAVIRTLWDNKIPRSQFSAYLRILGAMGEWRKRHPPRFRRLIPVARHQVPVPRNLSTSRNRELLHRPMSV